MFGKRLHVSRILSLVHHRLGFWEPYLASGQGLPPFCGHLIDDLLPKLGRQLVALGTPPLDDG